MKSVLKSFSEHGTFVQPDALDYIMSKDKPEEFASYIIGNLKEYPLVLTIFQIKEIEQSSRIEETLTPAEDSIEKKEVQKRMLSTLYSGELQYKPSEDTELEYDDPDKDDQIDIPAEETEEPEMPEVIKIKKVKGWKPKATEYEPEIEIIKDVTGKSTCEGTTTDFTKLFVNRYKALRKILQNQRREMANIMPIQTHQA